MKTKKPDRFERIVLAAIKKQDTPESPSVWLNGPDIVKLLRQEHRAVVGMLAYLLEKANDTYSDPSDNEILLGYHECIDDILDQLKKRAT